MKKNKKEKIIILSIIIIGVIIDQITKRTAYKKGLNLSGFENNGYYIIMSILIMILIIRYISKDNSFIKLDTKIILSFAIAGDIGNLIDRILNGTVIVFMNIGNIIDMNLAYIYIIIAWVGMAIILTKNTMKMLKKK